MERSLVCVAGDSNVVSYGLYQFYTFDLIRKVLFSSIISHAIRTMEGSD